MEIEAGLVSGGGRLMRRAGAKSLRYGDLAHASGTEEHRPEPAKGPIIRPEVRRPLASRAQDYIRDAQGVLDVVTNARHQNQRSA